MIYLTYCTSVILFSQLTLSVCVWWWSCDSLHGSRCWYRWRWGCPDDGVRASFGIRARIFLTCIWLCFYLWTWIMGTCNTLLFML